MFRARRKQVHKAFAIKYEDKVQGMYCVYPKYVAYILFIVLSFMF